MLEDRHPLVIAGRELIVMNLSVTDGIDEHVRSLGGGDGLDLIMGRWSFLRHR